MCKKQSRNVVTNVVWAFASQQLYISVSSGGCILVHPPRETNTLEIPPRKGSDEGGLIVSIWHSKRPNDID